MRTLNLFAIILLMTLSLLIVTRLVSFPADNFHGVDQVTYLPKPPGPPTPDKPPTPDIPGPNVPQPPTLLTLSNWRQVAIPLMFLGTLILGIMLIQKEVSYGKQ